MNRRQFLVGASTASAASAASAASTASAALAMQARKPNVVFVLPDQWRAPELPSSGDRQMIAPNLARLANEGVHFDRAYTSYPVCAPSRAAMVTGKFPHACRVAQNHVQLPLDQPSIAAQLKKAGYATGFIGKWHLDGRESPGFVPPGPRRRGFDYWAAFNIGYRYYDSIYFRDDPTPITTREFEPEYQTSLAIDFIRANKQKPFYLYLAFGPPHDPYLVPPEIQKLYGPRKLRVRDNVPVPAEDAARKDMAGYYGLCTAVDRQLGRLMKALDDEQLTGDTLLVFTSDHGSMMHSHGLESHNQPYEECAHIPLLMRYPRGFKAGATNDTLISNVDYMPTLLSLCGAEIPAGVQGRNLAPLLLTGKGDRPESIFSEGQIGEPGEWRMLVRGLDKLIIDRRGEVTHLFNLGQDPYEMENLVTSRMQLRTRDELLALMLAWRRKTEDGLTGSGLKKRG